MEFDNRKIMVYIGMGDISTRKGIKMEWRYYLMKTKKRFISFIVGAIFAICICSFSPIMSMQAYATSLVYGDFNYVIEENDEIEEGI